MPVFWHSEKTGDAIEKRKRMFVIKQLIKMGLQHLVLPLVYDFWRIVYGRKEPELILFADARHETLPYSMKNVYEELKEKEVPIILELYDDTKISQPASFFKAVHFMKLYAQAKVVFICDNFFPVISCRKSPKTKVVQMWHSCGLLKKMGYDTGEDIPKYYIGNVYKNYDLVTVSSPAVVPHLTSAMHQKNGIVKALGVSRTDTYFDTEWIDNCRKQFYERYPQAVGKKIVLWAPTFRGNAADPKQEGTEAVLKLEKELGKDYFVIRKVHPHVEARYALSNCEIPTEQLLSVADLMITDYSSVLFDYLFFQKPYVLFAPDLEEYVKKRGFYVDYESLSPYIVTKEEDLKENVLQALSDQDQGWIKAQYDLHIASCDGKVTKRILQYLGL